MQTVLDLLQAAGVGAAIGIRPFLPALLVGAMAAGNLGVDYGGTDFAFLEQAPFLVVMLAGLVVIDLIRRRAGDDRMDVGGTLIGLAIVAVVVSGLEGAGTLADRHHSIVAGIVVAVLAAALALLAVPPLFTRVRTRLGAEAGLLPLYREALALVVAGLSVLFPPLAIFVIAGLVWLLAGGRRRQGEKYAGLRILR
jgi:NO-binding membrane sensor protein with MHYT domain